MKRDELVKVIYSGLIEDVCREFPGYRTSLERDLVRLLRNTEKLSHYFYALEMPRINAAFRQCLVVGNSGALRGVNHCKWHPICSYPLLFSSLWSEIFSGAGLLLERPNPRALFYIQELTLVFKKIDGGCDSDLDIKAKDEFFAQESRIREPTLQWNVGDFDPRHNRHLLDADRGGRDDLTAELFPSTGGSVVDPRLPAELQRVADIFAGSLSWYNPEEWQCAHGPGAVSDKPRSGDKYDFRFWPSRLDSLFAYDAHADIGLSKLDYSDHEHPAKLICVPKDARGPRLIASEPSYLQFAQQSINSYLRAEIDRSMIASAINFNDQTYSQDRAIGASIAGKFATVDLKSASDLLSLWLVERLFRRNPPLLSAIQATRSRYVTDGTRTIFMRKVAPMGNAYIFPLQTCVYTLMCVAALAVVDGKEIHSSKQIRRYAREVQVFGDDIIIPERGYRALVSLLTYSGLKVNASKSFAEGNFREACGVDAYQGYDITPAYVKQIPTIESPETLVSTVDCVNNLYEKGLYSAADRLRSLIPSKIHKWIPEVHRCSGAFGFRVSQPYNENLKLRFNRDLQKLEALVIVPSTKVNNKQPEGLRNLLQFVTENPSPLQRWISGIKVPLSQRMRLRWVPVEGMGL
jgi:hypothetical protein